MACACLAALASVSARRSRRRLDRRGRRSSGTPPITTDGARSASISSAGPRPRSVRIAGCRPRASSRSSSTPALSSSAPRPSLAACGSSSASPRDRSCSATATSRCWAPSCRLRSSRRRSASLACTMRARDAASFSWRRRWRAPGRRARRSRDSRGSAPAAAALGRRVRGDQRAPQPAGEDDRRGDGGGCQVRAGARRAGRGRRLVVDALAWPAR